MLDAGHILYTQTRIDRLQEDDRSEYHLIVLDLVTQSTDTLTVPWSPESIPVAVKRMEPTYSEFLTTTFEVEPVVREIMDDTEYYPPLKALRTDQGIAFGFHFCLKSSAMALPTDSTRHRTTSLRSVYTGSIPVSMVCARSWIDPELIPGVILQRISPGASY